MFLFSKKQIFVVTGASSGIGEGVTLLLNKLGATVIAVARNKERLQEVKSNATFVENIFIEQKDLAADIATLPDYVKSLKQTYGKLQGMAYCAGVSEIKPLSVSSLDDLHRVFAINYFAPLMMLKGFLDRRINNGKGASAVLISSAAAILSDRGHTAYSGSKSALCASCKSIAKEVAPAGLRVNCVLPSNIHTPMTEAWAPFRKDPSEKYSMGFGEVNDVANMIAFLLSDNAKWITGQDYVIDCASF